MPSSGMVLEEGVAMFQTLIGASAMQCSKSSKSNRSIKPMPYPILAAIHKDGSPSFSTLPTTR